ncbi:MAG: hypothetical protein N838_20805 [Thiohalocapsa sp. PB-PSB1]|jgi:hypothetical protein|nr:MAG: hypothetical protein N838_20805 [Thiohalocapsa sp. PB-PSB1]HCS88763.1 hypothetical protein [Chromatiaceae bacterium]
MITPAQESCWEHPPAGIQTSKRVALGTLGEVQDIINEFQWFQVSSNSFPGKKLAYPEQSGNTEIKKTTDVA